jgi:hypothetical protein
MKYPSLTVSLSHPEAVVAFKTALHAMMTSRNESVWGFERILMSSLLMV